jgi:hypothetical protein
MKNLNYTSRIHKYLFFILLIATFACEEEIPEVERLPALQPASLDADAVNWKTVLDIDYASQLDLAPPASVGSDEYQNELLELVNLTQNRSNAQEEAINYWAAGGVIRWNQIARELVAKSNVAPPVDASPDPARPFANPPFAARAYALLSVAQQDALIVSWRLKFEHNRPAPANTESSIVTILPESGLPSYPSEQAAIAEASYQVLSYLFPAEEAFLRSQAEEHAESMRWAGVNTQSDIVGGKSIGDLVAEQIINYGKNDRMNQADDPEGKHLAYFDISNQIAVPWECIEKPLRRPMLPFYSTVKTWFDSTEVYAALPPPPPPVGSEEFEVDLKSVRSYSDNRTREQWRIADYWADGGGTSTPPGHWNRIAEELILEAKFSEVRAARTYSVTNRAMMDGGILCWYSKYKYYLPRPSQMDPNIKIATGIPNFPAYTSGHSTFSSSGGTVLGYIFPDHREELKSMYEEAGISRVYGGIHYNFDNIEGRVAGVAIGQIAIEAEF